MGEPAGLTDFFAKKNKKKVKGTNLNAAPTANKADDKKSKTKDTEEEGWQEEQVVASTMRVEVAGNLTRSEDKKEEEDTSAPAWGKIRQAGADRSDLNEKRFPSLKGPRTNINLDDGKDGKVNIETSKNVFAALENEDDDSDKEGKRPKEIKPAMVQKKKGEFQKAAIQREVSKYTDKKKKPKKEKTEDGEEEDESEEEEDEEEVEEKEDAEREERRAAAAEAKKKDAKDKKDAKKAAAEEEAEEDVEDDVKIVADPVAAKQKYENRKKPFAAKSIPRSEREEEKKVKEVKPVAQSSKKKKFAMVDEEDNKPKIAYAPF